MKDLLKEHVGTRQIIRINRRRPSTPQLDGYLLATSETLGLIHVVADFKPDGYIVFRIDDVVDIKSGPIERWWDHMLRSEGLLGGLDLPVQIDLSTMQMAIESIAQHYDQMIIQCEDEEEDIEDFYIGSLLLTSHENVVFRHYDGLGYWCREPAEIDIDEITLVQFDAPYINIFSKYTREEDASEERADE